mmetsp:Transcript_61608/g.74110  ORF Transcript_61608/g.74110 Transcript_61608/m.74110 type:complete len:158 (-) Transcript_61608:300-773(-)
MVGSVIFVRSQVVMLVVRRASIVGTSVEEPISRSRKRWSVARLKPRGNAIKKTRVCACGPPVAASTLSSLNAPILRNRTNAKKKRVCACGTTRLASTLSRSIAPLSSIGQLAWWRRNSASGKKKSANRRNCETDDCKCKPNYEIFHETKNVCVEAPK